MKSWRAIVAAVVVAAVLVPVHADSKESCCIHSILTKPVVRRFSLQRCDPFEAGAVLASLINKENCVACIDPEPASGSLGSMGGMGSIPSGMSPCGSRVSFLPPSRRFETGLQPAQSGLRVVVDRGRRIVVARGTEEELALVAEVIAVLETADEEKLPATKTIRAYRVERKPAELIELAYTLDPTASYILAPVGRRIVARGNEAALADLATLLREVDVPARKPKQPLASSKAGPSRP